jgi:hypothetical protein
VVQESNAGLGGRDGCRPGAGRQRLRESVRNQVRVTGCDLGLPGAGRFF